MEIELIATSLDFNLSGDDSLNFSLSVNDGLTFSVSTPTLINTDIYTGVTDVAPDFYGLTLKTSHKFITNDITVKPIQVENVSNISGGITVYIGGII